MKESARKGTEFARWGATAILMAFFAMLVACLALASCSPEESDEGKGVFGSGGSMTVGSDETWSVFVYLCGSNLESDSGYATDNLAELLTVNLPDNVNFVIETGGSNTWQNDVVNATYIERYEVHDGKMYLQDQLPRESMGNEATLSSFLAWGVRTYPADHYMVVFWDHGGGSLAGACLDELDGDVLTLPEIRDGIAAADVTFDIVGFDACLMASLENAQILAPYADYLVASEEIEPGGGWAWDAWPKWFASPTGDGVVGLGACICDTYMDKCEASEVAETATLSVVDLSRIDAVTSSFDEAGQGMALSCEHPVPMQRLVQDGRDVQSFGHANYIEGYTDMVDLADLMVCMDEPLGKADDKVIAAVRDAVVYERHGEYCSKASGLSVFYPLQMDDDTFNGYYELARENDLGCEPYLQYLAVRAGTFDTISWTASGVQDLNPVSADEAEGKMRCTSMVDEDGRFTVHIDRGTEWVMGANFYLGMVLDDNTVAMLGSDNNMDVYVDEQTYDVDFKDRFDDTWYKIGDAYVYAEIVDMVAEDGEPSYNLYSTPVELTTTSTLGTPITVQTNVLSMYDYHTNQMQVLCVYEDADETGMAGKTTRALQEGDQLRFLVERQVDGKTQGGSTGTITWENDTPMTTSYVGDATYVYLVEVYDIFGNVYHPDPGIITFENGNREVKVGQYG